MLEEHRDEFENMEEDTYDLIGTLGNMSQIKKMKNECRTEKGGLNMCKGMEDWLEEREHQGLERGRAEGKTEGKAEGIKALIEICEELGVSKEETYVKLKNKFQEMKEEQVEQYLNLYWNAEKI